MDNPPHGQSHALTATIKDLKIASTLPPKQRPIPITTLTAAITHHTTTTGLSPAPLLALLDLITRPSHLDQASLNILIRNLYPAEKVGLEAGLRVLGCLGNGKAKPKFVVQAALIRWLLCVWEVLDGQGRKGVVGGYGVLFALLDVMQLRAPLCHLLSLITRRKHVRPYRIQMLLELSRKAGHEPALVGLLRVYKDYYPDIIVGDAASGRASVFLHPNREFSQRLAGIQEANLQRSALAGLAGKSEFRVVRRGVNGSKRGKSSIIPEVRTSNALESSITLEEISSVQILVHKLEKIDLPNQLVSVMGDPALQKLLLLKSTSATLRRVDYWLKAFFDDQLAKEDGPGARQVVEMLEAVGEYARFSKVLPPACLNYLQTQLKDWNGTTGQAVILDLLAYLPIQPFQDLYKSTLQPLETAILDSTSQSQLTLLNFYTHLLHNWTLHLHTTTTHMPTIKITTPLISHVNRLALALMTNHTSPVETGPSHPLTEPTVLNWLSATTALLQPPIIDGSNISFPQHRIIVPQAALIYTLHFSTSLCTLSRLYSILSSYKRAFELQTQRPSTPLPAANTNVNTAPPVAIQRHQPITYPKEYVNNFNSFLMDICNCLWRDKAFNFSEVNAMACLLPKELFIPLSTYLESLNTGLTLPTLFNLSHHHILCKFSIGYIRQLEDEAADGEGGIRLRHAGPATAKSLSSLARDGGVRLGWLEYRLGVLRELESGGAGGVGELMFNTMKNLMGRK